MRWIARTALIAAAGLMVVALPSQAQDKEKPKKGDRYTITQYDMQQREDLKTAWEVANQLRPQWFRTRGRTTTSSFGSEMKDKANPIVYIDNMKQMSMDVLKELRSSEVVEMKFMEPQKAMALYDDTHAAGAIFVKTIRMP
jgi:hypothetical protein